MIQPLGGTVWRCLKKLGIKLSHDGAIQLLGIYPEKPQFKKTHGPTPMFAAALFTIART